jgi:hypothetical protein
VIDNDIYFTTKDVSDLSTYNVALDFIGYRDEIVGLPLQIGKPHKDFVAKSTSMVTAPVKFPALTSLKLIFTPVTIGKIPFTTVKKGETVKYLLAKKILEMLVGEAKKEKKQCKIATIVVAIQPVLIRRELDGSVVVPGDLVHKFKV